MGRSKGIWRDPQGIPACEVGDRAWLDVQSACCYQSLRVMAPPLDENSAPEAFAGHPEAGVSPYYKAMAKDLGGAQTSPGAKAIRVKDILKGQYARSKLGAMFRLTSSQFDKVLTQAGAAVEWRDMVEETVGGKFAAPECPSSARLMVVSASG